MIPARILTNKSKIVIITDRILKRGEKAINIKRKISVPMIILAIGGCLIVLASSILFYIGELKSSTEDKIHVAFNIVQHELDDIEEQLRLAAIGMSDNRELAEALKNNDRDTVEGIVYKLKAMLLLLDYCTVTDADGGVVFSSGVRSIFGLTHDSPVYDESGAVAGFITVGYMLDKPEISAKMKALTGCEVTIFFGDERVSTTIMNEYGDSAANMKAPQYVSDKVLGQGEVFLGRVLIFGNEMLGKYTPLYGDGEEIIGMLFVGQYTNTDAEKIFIFILNGVLITLAVLLACFMIARVISGVFEQQFETVMNEIHESREAAETASNAKSTFLANMSHEIRTPMNTILGITDTLIQNESLPQEFEEGLSKIYTSCNMLLGIINDILDFSKIEAGKLSIITSEYHIASLISDAVQLNIMRTEGKPIEFELLASENLPANLIGDELRIKQILNNLLSNAFKYTESGRITLTVGFELGESENEVTLLISVRDTGDGMTEEQLENLFAEYSRFEKDNRTVEGTGLGLAITRRILHLMGGEINVVSEPGDGSLFSVKLPQLKASQRALGSEMAANLRHFRFNSHIHNKYDRMVRNPMPYGSVLVVDDVENNLYVAVGLMKPYKLRIDTALSGQEAIDKVIENNQYDIVFMDHMMPGMSGLEAAAHIRALNFSGAIVALTANAVEGAAEMFLRNGFDDFISKPIDLRQLDIVLNKLVRDKQLPEVLEAAKLQITETGEQKPAKTRISSDKIAGLDIERGIRRYDDDLKIYLQVLRSFASSILPLIEGIEDIEIDKENLEDYRIKAHGIKGASFNVFADLLGKKAEELEKAATSGDLISIKSQNFGLINIARKLIGDIDIFITAADSGNKKDKKDKPDSEILSQLLNACRNYNVDGVDAAMDEIERYEYDSKADNELSAWLRENVNMMKFKEIAEKLAEKAERVVN